MARVDPVLFAALHSTQTALSNYEASQRPEDLEEASCRAMALARVPALAKASVRFQADALHLGARVFLARFARFGDSSDLTTARLWLGHARTLVGTGTADAANYLDSLAASLAERFEQTGDVALMQEALSLSEEAVALTPSDHPNRPAHLNTLASRCSERFRQWGEMTYLETAIASLEEAIALTSEDHPNRPIYFTNLANRRSERFWQLGDLTDLEAGIAAAQEAVARTDEDHPSRAIRLHNLANVLADRFGRLGQITDLHAAIDAAGEALTFTPDGHPHKPAMLHNLANMHTDQFRRLGNIRYLEAAVEAAKEAVAITPSDHRLRPAMLHTLANAQSERFSRLGEIADLEAAIAAAEEAVTLTSDGNPDRPGRLNNLANMRFERFRRWGEVSDLEAAISATEEALMHEGHPERPNYLNNLATMRSYRFRRLGKDADLEASVVAAEEAVSLTEKDLPDRPMYLNTLANRRLERFRQIGNLADLEAAIAAAGEAADLIPDGHPSRHRYLNNLAMGQSYRFHRLSHVADLEAAIEAATEAVSLTPDDHPGRPMYLNNLADMRMSRYSHLGEFADLEAAIAALRQAITQLHAMVVTEPQLSRLAGQANEYTRKLVGLLWTAGHFSELATAIENGRGVRLRADVVRADKVPQGLSEAETARFRGLVRQQRQLRAELEGLRAALADVQVLAQRLIAQIEAAAVAERVVKEETRTQTASKEARLKAELIEKRSLLFQLREEREALEARDLNFDPPVPSFVDLRDLAGLSGDAIVYIHPVSQDLGTLWQIVHAGSGSGEACAADQQMVGTFTPARLHGLLANNPAAKDGNPAEPLGWLLVYLGWLAMQHHDAKPEAHASATTMWWASMDHVLTVLGNELLAPLAKRLHAIGAKRVVLIPGGQFAFLPLHAAKIDGNVTFGDLFEVRYAASATLLNRTYDRLFKSSPVQPRLTAIANPNRSLPFTDGQVRSVAKLFSEGAAKVAYGTKASKGWLLEHAVDADYLELSTHARFELGQPVQSAFQLAYENGYYEKSLRKVGGKNPW
jgi:tetratricopeptide (TPR) repeat protein